MKKRIWNQIIFLVAACSLAFVLFAGCWEVQAEAIVGGRTASAMEITQEEACAKMAETSLTKEPETTPGTDFANTPETHPTNVPETTPEIDPSRVPEPTPDTNPTKAPEQTPDTNPTEGPEPTPEANPTNAPGSEHTRAPEQTPEPTLTNTPEPDPTNAPELHPTEVPEITEKPAEKMDFRLRVTPDEASPKAGSVLVYQVTVENTGECDIRNLELQPAFPKGSFDGSWEAAQGIIIYEGENRAVLELLERGSVRELLYCIDIPEEQTASVSCTFTAKACEKELPDGTAAWLKKEVELEVPVVPLTVEFTVKKTADRAQAVPGDAITYQICIRNTGERALHSVLTTERFLTEGVQARFLQQEGVLLNGSASQALISRIEPGEAAGLLAEVTLPENMTAQELINEVSVVTKETGERVFQAQASVQILQREAVSEPYNGTDGFSNAQKASTHPKTADGYRPEVWIGIFLISAAAATRTFWSIKGQRKH